jgi:hypothetical protein
MQPSVIAEIDSPVFPNGTYFIPPPSHTPHPKNEAPSLPTVHKRPSFEEDDPACHKLGRLRAVSERARPDLRVGRRSEVEGVASDAALVGEEPVLRVDASGEAGE